MTEKEQNWIVYPTKVADELTIEYQGVLQDKKHYVIYTLDGKKIKTGFLSQNIEKISMSTLTSGLYIIKISENASTYTQRIVKE